MWPPKKPTLERGDGAGPLRALWPTALLGLAGRGAAVDEPSTLTLGTDLHRSTPSQRWAYRSRSGSITGCERSTSPLP
jgi:hypothetical protein